MKLFLLISLCFTVSVFSFDKKVECSKAIDILDKDIKYVNLIDSNKKLLKNLIEENSKLQKERKKINLNYCIKNLTKKELKCINNAKSLYYSKKCLAKNNISKKRESIHKYEIKLIKKLIENINYNEKSFKKKKKNKNKCEITLFSKENKNIKVIKTCKNKKQKIIFEYYSIIIPRNSTKIIYSNYTKLVNNKILKYYDIYSIGSILKSDEHFGKIFDKNGKPIKKNAYKIENMMEQNYISSIY